METPEEQKPECEKGCVLLVRDRGIEGDPTIILKKDLDAAKAHKRRIIERVAKIQPGECPFEIEIFHLVPVI